LSVHNIKLIFVLFSVLFCSGYSQEEPIKEIWKELSKNKFAVVFYDLSSLALAKTDFFEQPIKTEYNSEQSLPGLSAKYFSEIIVYMISLKDAKYLIKKASYYDRKKKEIKVFEYLNDGKIDPKQMIPVTKGSPVYEVILLHKLLHGKKEPKSVE